MKKITFIMLLMLLSSIVFSQKDTIVYYSNVEIPILLKDSASKYEKVIKVTDNKFFLYEYHRNNYDIKSLKWSEGTTYEINKTNDSTYILTYSIGSQGELASLTRVLNKVNDGYIIKAYKDKKLIATGFSYLVFPLIKEGKWTYYNSKSGIIIKEETYSENRVISNRNWKENGEEGISDVFIHPDIMPEFIGGENEFFKFLMNNVKYPQVAREEGTTGVVYITFIVMEDGSLNDIRILRGIGSGCDEEAMRVVKLMNGKWKPGYINNKIVRVQFNLPLKFTLR